LFSRGGRPPDFSGFSSIQTLPDGACSSSTSLDKTLDPMLAYALIFAGATGGNGQEPERDV
jgi:hypothetical protein